MVGIDTNILLYACDKGSPFHEEAKTLIKSMFGEGGIAISDLSLLEFFSVATDGRKMTTPLLAKEALKVIEKIWNAEEFRVCSGNAEIMRKTFRCAEELNMLRYGINDVYIAMSLAENKFNRILTRNTKDFKKFDFIEAVNPFKSLAPRFIPYARQSIDENDVAAVCKVLRSDWLTTGPKVSEFEEAFAQYAGAKHAVAVSSGTAALHAAMFALGIGPKDEVIVPPMTFAATANCVVYRGATPIFVDVDPNTLLIDPVQVEAKITPKTRAVIGVDYAGQPCDWDALRDIATHHDLVLIADGCHALGAEYKGKRVGCLADLTAFSFHPVKHITTGEGGMITTDNSEFAERMRIFRNHGITRDPARFASPEGVKIRSALGPRPSAQSWFYEMRYLGYNYRITDFQCALGLSQMTKLSSFLQRRWEIAALYDDELACVHGIKPLDLRPDVLSAKQTSAMLLSSAPLLALNGDPLRGVQPGCSMPLALCALPSLHAYHLYVLRMDLEVLSADRAAIFQTLRQDGIGVNVHYIPVHMHPFYRKHFGTGRGSCPVAEAAYDEIISLPMSAEMSDEDVSRVIEEVFQAVCH